MVCLPTPYAGAGKSPPERKDGACLTHVSLPPTHPYMFDTRLHPRIMADPESRAPALARQTLDAVWCTNWPLRGDSCSVYYTLRMLAGPGSVLRTGPSTTAHLVRASNVRPWAALPDVHFNLSKGVVHVVAPSNRMADGLTAPAENVPSERTILTNYAAADPELRLPSILFPIHD
jgi:hypothetical protein